jgi:hypothetical protein
MELQSTILPIKVGSKVVLARVTAGEEATTGIAGEVQVAARIPSFDEVIIGIEEMAKVLAHAFESIKPDKVKVEFNVALSLDSGKLVALFFETKTTGSLTVTLEWT